MLREKVPQSIKTAVKQFAAAHVAAREKTNEANRLKTVLRNEVKEYWTSEKLPIGSFIHYEGFEIRYEANEERSLDFDAVLTMFEKGTITREQFVRMSSVQRTEAKNVLGADVVADLEVVTAGTKLDIRLEQLPVENADDDYLSINRNIKKRVKRSVFGKEADKAKQSIASDKSATKRRIKVRK